MPFLENDGFKQYYEERGSGEPLILLHGALGTLHRTHGGWAESAEELAKRFHVFEIDMRGHGRSNNPKGFLTFELFAGDLARFIRAYKLGPSHIAGVSDGAITGLHLAIFEPKLVKSLVCVGVNYYNDDQVKNANAALARLPEERPEAIPHLMLDHDHGKGPEYWRELLRQISDNLAKNPDYSLRDLSKIEAPTFLIAGEEDSWANIDQMVAMRRAIPKSELLILNKAGHVVQTTHRHIVLPAVLKFLEEHSN